MFGFWYENFLKGFPKLARHSAVDGEVNRIANDEKKISKQNKHIGNIIIEKIVNKRGDYVQCRNDSKWYFHDQENRHHHDQHQRGAIGVTNSFAFALFDIILEESFALLLRLSHRFEQQHVQRY